MLAGKRCQVSDLLTSSKKKKENIEKSTHVAARLHCCGLTGSLTNKTGQLFDALPDNRAAAKLRSPKGQPGMRRRLLLLPAHPMPCRVFASQGQALQAGLGGLPVPRQKPRTCQRFPEKPSSRETSGHLFAGPAKEAQRRSQLGICCAWCLSESLL